MVLDEIENEKIKVYNLRELTQLKEQISSFVRKNGSKKVYSGRYDESADYYECFGGNPWMLVRDFPTATDVIVCPAGFERDFKDRNTLKDSLLEYNWYWDGRPWGKSSVTWDGKWVKEKKYEGEREVRPVEVIAEIPESFLSWFYSKSSPPQPCKSKRKFSMDLYGV